jgi:nucleotide-binding universal stress UspA family protein
VLEGPPVLALLEAAESEGADLIVVGRHGAGGVAGVFGSTSHDLAEHSHRPVIIVPPLA